MRPINPEYEQLMSLSHAWKTGGTKGFAKASGISVKAASGRIDKLRKKHGFGLFPFRRRNFVGHWAEYSLTLINNPTSENLERLKHIIKARYDAYVRATIATKEKRHALKKVLQADS